MRTLSVLLVEDDVDDAYLVRRLIAQARSAHWAFETVHCEDLAAAASAAAGRSFDVALLDLMLPGSAPGSTLIRFLTEHPEMPVVVLTGVSDERVAVDAVTRGAQDYLIKGAISPEILRRSLTYAVSRKHLEDGLRTVFETVADGLVVLDERGRVRLVNPAAQSLFGRDAQDLIGASLPFPVGEGAAREFDLPPFTAGTAWRRVLVRAASMRWGGGDALLVTLRDVTQARRAEELIEQARRGREFGAVTRDLPGFLRRVLLDPLGAAGSRAGRDMVLTDLREWARDLEALVQGSQPARSRAPVRLDLEGLVRRAVDQAGAAGRVEVRAESGVAPVAVDAEDLQNALRRFFERLADAVDGPLCVDVAAVEADAGGAVRSGARVAVGTRPGGDAAALVESCDGLGFLGVRDVALARLGLAAAILRGTLAPRGGRLGLEFGGDGEARFLVFLPGSLPAGTEAKR